MIFTDRIYFLSSTVLKLWITTGFPVQPRLGEKMTLICTVEPADDLIAEIAFVRHKRQTNFTFGPIHQGLSNCDIEVKDFKYVTSCGAGTNTSSSRVKQYMMTIRSMKEEDFTKWWCQRKSRPQTNNVVVILERCK